MKIVHVYRRNRLMNNLSCAFNNSQKTINEKNSLVFFLVPQPSAYRNNVPIYNAKLFNRKSSCNKNEFNAWPNRGLLQLPSPLIAYMKKKKAANLSRPSRRSTAYMFSLTLSSHSLSLFCFIQFQLQIAYNLNCFGFIHHKTKKSPFLVSNSLHEIN